MNIQSAYDMPNKEKLIQESNSLNKIKNSFRKIIIVKDSIIPWKTDDGIEVISLKDFLLKNINIF